MKNFRNMALLAVAFMTCMAFTTEEKPQEVYMFGIAASFNDSTVYFTDIQRIEGARLNKHGFLEARNQYAYQLKNFLENQKNLPNRTCTILFNKKKSKLEKEYSKLRQEYQANKAIKYQNLNMTEFKFLPFNVE